MDREQYEQAVSTAHMVAVMLADIDFGQAAALADRAQGVGPILDPTLYMQNGDQLAQDLDVLRAAADFNRAVSLSRARHNVG